jgi:hypothetical protein
LPDFHFNVSSWPGLNRGLIDVLDAKVWHESAPVFDFVKLSSSAQYDSLNGNLSCSLLARFE